MKIVGQMSITNFPLWEMCLTDLAKYCNELYLRFDNCIGDRNILNKLIDPAFLDGKIKNVLVSNLKWNKGNWREEQLRLLDIVRPDIVLTPDQDEMFEDSLGQELKHFWESDKKAMMFSYANPMPTDDGRSVNNWPVRPHMKVYKWDKGLTYKRYRGDAKVSNYVKRGIVKRVLWKAETKIKHYCFYTKEIEITKMEQLKLRHQNRSLRRAELRRKRAQKNITPVPPYVI